MRILVVDDSPEIVKILSCTMELSGHEVDEAYDGIDAVDRIRDNIYDVVITDAEMPRMRGIEGCRFLKAVFPDVFVIGMSGLPQGAYGISQRRCRHLLFQAF
ncbi:MAG TPA: response regulator [Syntrophales bacterium]|nr:response regulator [Syntrophales bacterium]